MPPSLKDSIPLTFMNRFDKRYYVRPHRERCAQVLHSSDLHHHIFFGASMMFLATGKQQYKIDAQLRILTGHQSSVRRA
jgi:hypothetical protein